MDLRAFPLWLLKAASWEVTLAFSSHGKEVGGDL